MAKTGARGEAVLRCRPQCRAGPASHGRAVVEAVDGRPATADGPCPLSAETTVNGLDVCGVEPDRGTDAGLSNGCSR